MKTILKHKSSFAMVTVALFLAACNGGGSDHSAIKFPAPGQGSSGTGATVEPKLSGETKIRDLQPGMVLVAKKQLGPNLHLNSGYDIGYRGASESDLGMSTQKYHCIFNPEEAKVGTRMKIREVIGNARIPGTALNHSGVIIYFEDGGDLRLIRAYLDQTLNDVERNCLGDLAEFRRK